MPTSIIRLRDLNVPPFPSEIDGTYSFYSSGPIVGGDDALDSADEDSSYVETFSLVGDIQQIITCHMVADPPIPPTAIVGTDIFFAPSPGSHTQLRLADYHDFPAVWGPGWLLRGVNPDGSLGLFLAGFGLPDRSDEAWQDETAGPNNWELFLSAIVQYLNTPNSWAFILNTNAFPEQNIHRRTSQILLSVDWTVPSTYLRMTQRNDGLGISRHPRIGQSSGSKSNSDAPRVGTNNMYF